MKRTALERKTPLARGAKPLKRGRRRKLSTDEREQALRFKLAVWNRVCAVCGGRTYFGGCDAHHVVEAQHLRRNGLPVYDARNALPVCDDCHERHTNASRRIPLSALTPANLEFAREVLGDFADDYLRRRYAS